MKHLEDNLLIQTVTYLRYQYPDVLFTHIANERRTSPQAGVRLKRKGVTAGMPDLLIFYPIVNFNVFYCGLAIELKVGKNKQTDSQKLIEGKLKASRWLYDVCYTFDEVKKLIDSYLTS